MKMSVAIWLAAALSTPFCLSAAEPTTGFAVVELFTSEGCSSCPPADRLLKELAQKQQNSAVYCLGFHVDYWNRLGWRDRFSTAAATQRQQFYARHFENEQIYTPQMIVNGATEFVGSDRKLASAAVARALQTKPTHSLSLNAKAPNDKREIAVHVRAEKDTEGLVALVALVQRQAESRVTRGENEGRTLAHNGIVRDFRTFKLYGEGTGVGTLTLPADVEPKDVDVIGFLQNGETAAITAASKVTLALP